MFKFILERIYPDAPKSVSATEIVQGAVIEALTAHLARLGHQVSAVSVPASVMPTDICRFTTAAGSFWVQPGLDPFGDNVITSALPSGTVTNSTTASASVAAETVPTNFRSAYQHPDPATQALTRAVFDGLAAQIAPPPPSDDDLSEMISDVLGDARFESSYTINYATYTEARNDLDEVMRVANAYSKRDVRVEVNGPQTRIFFGKFDNGVYARAYYDGPAEWVEDTHDATRLGYARAVLRKLRSAGVIR